MLVPERRALGALEQHLSAEATRRFRASWRVGWHAGRLFALREGGAR